MSRFSSTKRLQSDIASHEENSDRRIQSDMYYILVITLSDEVSANSAKISSSVKEWLKTRTEHQALAAYVYRNEIHLVFSSVEGKEHYLSGSHHSLCSEYASLASLTFGCRSYVKIVELESRTLILLYFQIKIFENAKRSAHQLSKGSITKKELIQLTFAELVQNLQDRAKVTWDKVPAAERYGIFYKYSIEGNKKERYVTMSETINIQDPERYISYLFE